MRNSAHTTWRSARCAPSNSITARVNIELFREPASGRMRVIEINPRLAAQFGDLYWKVDGTQPYSVLTDLSTGRAPRYTRRQGPFAHAASFVLRAFDDAAKVAPSRAHRDWLAARYPDAALCTFIKHGASRSREEKWLGSYRYAIVNLGGTSRETSSVDSPRVPERELRVLRAPSCRP